MGSVILLFLVTVVDNTFFFTAFLYLLTSSVSVFVVLFSTYVFHPWSCRQKRKERKQQRKLERQAQAEERTDCPERKRVRKEAEPSPLRLVVDCSFDSLMMLKVRPTPLTVQTFIHDPLIQYC